MKGKWVSGVTRERCAALSYPARLQFRASSQRIMRGEGRNGNRRERERKRGGEWQYKRAMLNKTLLGEEDGWLLGKYRAFHHRCVPTSMQLILYMLSHTCTPSTYIKTRVQTHFTSDHNHEGNYHELIIYTSSSSSAGWCRLSPPLGESPWTGQSGSCPIQHPGTSWSEQALIIPRLLDLETETFNMAAAETKAPRPCLQITLLSQAIPLK